MIYVVEDKTMKSKKKLIFFSYVLMFVVFSCLFIFNNINIRNAANAETDTDICCEAVQSSEESTESGIEPRLFTSLSISLNGGNGKVWATVKNDFTLFPSTVLVIVQLYTSYNYCESYTQMSLVSENSISDLNIGKTISAESSTNGEEKYWMGRMRYKIDGKSWAEKTVGVLKYSANGDYIGIL